MMVDLMLKKVMETTIQARDDALRRLWHARDDVEKKRRALDDAEARLSFAQADYDEWTRQLAESWPLFRSEIEAMPIKEVRGE